MIRIPEATSITFTFEELDISPEDHLDFYDISTMPNVLLNSFTGNENPGTVTYYSNRIQVSFTADNYLNASGFKVYWSTDAAGIEDFGTKMSVHPNPASDLLHVTLSDAGDACVGRTGCLYADLRCWTIDRDSCARPCQWHVFVGVGAWGSSHASENCDKALNNWADGRSYR